jgi:hypothetical protein
VNIFYGLIDQYIGRCLVINILIMNVQIQVTAMATRYTVRLLLCSFKETCKREIVFGYSVKILLTTSTSSYVPKITDC